MKKQERIYIVPTKYGFIYVLGIFVTLAAAAIYANNLVYLLSFFLVALVLMGMVQTHSNLKGLSLDKVHLELAPAEAKGDAKFWFSSSNKEGHNQLYVQSKIDKKKFSFPVTHLTGNGLSIKKITFHTGLRGKQKIGAIKVSTTYPFGFFYAWRIFNFEQFHFIYPHAKGTTQLPDEKFLGDSVDKNRGANGEDFTQHRNYILGESHRHIDWKAYARGRPLLVKDFSDGEKTSLSLRYQDVVGNTEEKLSQLSLWVLLCERKNMLYSLQIANHVYGPSKGHNHMKNCLKILAEYST
ncbi:MAG: DUF58 domain-containing protein [Bdellovibrionales bacterium]|nr:DUF58 domain-containing protein [Bdellovibrionales bacterium]